MTDSSRRSLLRGLLGVSLGAVASLHPRWAKALTLGSRGETASNTASGAVSKSPLDRLLDKIAKSPGLEATFREERLIALLAKPLVSAGKVYFLTSPPVLVRHVEQPKPSRLLVDSKRIVIIEDGKRREVDLVDKPAVRALVTSLLHVLSGNRKALEKDFTVKFRGDVDKTWQLVLTPRRPPLNKLLRELTLAGHASVLDSLIVSESSGDETRTHFSNVNSERRFSDDEKHGIFDLSEAPRAK